MRLGEESGRVVVEALLKSRKGSVILVLQSGQTIVSSPKVQLTVEGAVLNSSR
jgi:hypothetical protein